MSLYDTINNETYRVIKQYDNFIYCYAKEKYYNICQR
jgi:hypothetical protein